LEGLSLPNHSRKILHHRKKILQNLVACSAGAFTINGMAWLAQQNSLPLLIPPFGARASLSFCCPKAPSLTLGIL